MAGYKVRGRLERMEWKPPLLTFQIERHGRSCLGSTRADLQRWTVNLERKTADCERAGHRQLHPTAPRISIQGLADEVVGRIVRGEPDDRLERNNDGSVWVVYERNRVRLTFFLVGL